MISRTAGRSETCRWLRSAALLPSVLIAHSLRFMGKYKVAMKKLANNGGQLPERFGGFHGLGDEGVLESAFARLVDKASRSSEDIIELAAAYPFGLAKNHAFIDGNKRIAIAAAAVFLMDNGHEIEAGDANLYTFVLGIAAGEIDEDGAIRFLGDFPFHSTAEGTRSPLSPKTCRSSGSPSVRRGRPRRDHRAIRPVRPSSW